jgi:hypothetical protein
MKKDKKIVEEEWDMAKIVLFNFMFVQMGENVWAKSFNLGWSGWNRDSEGRIALNLMEF